jgi:holo-[acyl-carrier protein] synthase
MSKKNAAQRLAVRYAAKEAVWKALSAVKRGPLSHRDISVKNGPDGKPLVILPAVMKKLQKKIRISLSHTKEYAAAIAVLS